MMGRTCPVSLALLMFCFALLVVIFFDGASSALKFRTAISSAKQTPTARSVGQTVADGLPRGTVVPGILPGDTIAEALVATSDFRTVSGRIASFDASMNPNHDELSKVMLGKDEYPLAVCTDGSQAGYYYKMPEKQAVLDDGSARWLVFLEGGGWCWTWPLVTGDALQAASKPTMFLSCAGLRTGQKQRL